MPFSRKPKPIRLLLASMENRQSTPIPSLDSAANAWGMATPDANNPGTISYTLQNPGDNFARLKVIQLP